MQIDGPVVALIVAHASTQVGAVIHAQPVATLDVATPHQRYPDVEDEAPPYRRGGS